MIRYHTTLSKLCQIVMCVCIFLPSCKQPEDQKGDLSRYYFPINSLSADGIVYSYRNVQDSTAAPEVWRHIKKGPNLIESINYGFDNEVVQRQFDRIVDNGVITDSLVLYSRDSIGELEQIDVTLLSPHRFPFEPGDSSQVWLTKMDWWQPGNALHIVLERRRRFQGFTTWNRDGRSIPAVRFSTEDTFETEADGWTSSSWTGEEIYAEDIGLVYYKRVISESMLLEFELEE